MLRLQKCGVTDVSWDRASRLKWLHGTRWAGLDRLVNIAPEVVFPTRFTTQTDPMLQRYQAAP